MVSSFGTQESYQDLKLLHPRLQLPKDTVDALSSKLLDGLDKTGKRYLDLETESQKICTLTHALVIYLLLNKKIEDYFSYAEEKDLKRIYIKRETITPSSSFNFPSMRVVIGGELKELKYRLDAPRRALEAAKLAQASFDIIRMAFCIDQNFAGFSKDAAQRLECHHDKMLKLNRESSTIEVFPLMILKELNILCYLLLTDQIQGFNYSEFIKKIYVYSSLNNINSYDLDYILTKPKLMDIIKQAQEIAFENSQEVIDKINQSKGASLQVNECEKVGRLILTYLMMPFFGFEMDMPSNVIDKGSHAAFLLLTDKIASCKFYQSTNKWRIYGEFDEMRCESTRYITKETVEEEIYGEQLDEELDRLLLYEVREASPPQRHTVQRDQREQRV